MELNQTAQDLIATFAKANRVSKAKTNEFVQLMLAATGSTAKKAGGRGASDAILALRAKIQENLQTITTITAKDAAKQFNVSYIEAYDTLNHFEKMGYFVREGVKEHEAGQRGRKQVVWAAAQK